MTVTLRSQTQRTAVSGSSEAGGSDVEDSDDNSASSAHTAVEEDELADGSDVVDEAASGFEAPGRWSPLYDPQAFELAGTPEHDDQQHFGYSESEDDEPLSTQARLHRLPREELDVAPRSPSPPRRDEEEFSDAASHKRPTLVFSDLISDLGESGEKSSFVMMLSLTSSSEVPQSDEELLRRVAATTSEYRFKPIKVPPLSKVGKGSRKGGKAEKSVQSGKGKAKAKAEPAAAKKASQKHHAASSSHTSMLPDSSPPPPIKRKRRRKSKAKRPESDGETRSSDPSDDEQNLSERPVKKRKSRAKPDRPPPPEKLTQWSVSAYLEVERPPQLVQKTPRSQKKLEPRDPWRGGPVTITHGTTWPELVAAIAQGMHVQKENLKIDSLCWKVAPTSDGRPHGAASREMRLPMTNTDGYNAFVEGGIRATGGTRSFIFCIAPPLNRHASSASCVRPSQSSRRSDIDLLWHL